MFDDPGRDPGGEPCRGDGIVMLQIVGEEAAGERVARTGGVDEVVRAGGDVGTDTVLVHEGAAGAGAISLGSLSPPVSIEPSSLFGRRMSMPRSCVTARKCGTPISPIIWNEPGSNDRVAPDALAMSAAERAAARGGSMKNDHAVRWRCRARMST